MKTFCTIFSIALICGCSKPPASSVSATSNAAVRWEYKIAKFDNIKLSKAAPVTPEELKKWRLDKSSGGAAYLDESQIHIWGQEGWELASTFTEMETVPDAEYFAGQEYIGGAEKFRDTYKSFSNQRTSRVVLIFKRPAP
jgi:hypothetical protein